MSVVTTCSTECERRAIAAGVPLAAFRGFARHRHDPAVQAALDKRLAQLRPVDPPADLGAALRSNRGQTPASRKETLTTTLSQPRAIGAAPVEPRMTSAPAAPDLAAAITRTRT